MGCGAFCFFSSSSAVDHKLSVFFSFSDTGPRLFFFLPFLFLPILLAEDVLSLFWVFFLSGFLVQGGATASVLEAASELGALRGCGGQ
ncbi:hypothetical protein RchiOBHm_Chr2g0122121 [Rosa chinensis]|uniref:Uncharacterized protein n=1 Tax=Rosa chinensis TaxID=74649 RepID=A0A2P6RSP2_ROSCH|nr:hypothetical protein RchiOBHm_Chr2g0122121 [Rosa chinensis]